jgi:hypothetical protein
VGSGDGIPTKSNKEEMKYRFYFNFPSVNEIQRENFLIHCSNCGCKVIGNSKNGFWTDWYDEYEFAYRHLEKLLTEFRIQAFEIKPCGQCS